MRRLKNDGLQTVSKLLHESRAENRILKEKNNQLERTVDTLSNRLLKSGLSRLTHLTYLLNLPTWLTSWWIRLVNGLCNKGWQPMLMQALLYLVQTCVFGTSCCIWYRLLYLVQAGVFGTCCCIWYMLSYFVHAVVFGTRCRIWLDQFLLLPFHWHSFWK